MSINAQQSIQLLNKFFKSFLSHNNNNNFFPVSISTRKPNQNNICVYLHKKYFFGVFRLRREYLFNHLGSLNWFSGTMYDFFFFIIVSFANSCSFFAFTVAHLIEANEMKLKRRVKKNRRRKNLKGKY